MTDRASPITGAQLARVLDLLAPRADRRPRIVDAEPLGSQWAPVTRLHLDVPVTGAGTSVVVKTTRRDGGAWGTVDWLHRGRAAADLLHGTGVAPLLLAADDELELVVLSDAIGSTLESVLLAGDAAAATAAMVALGDTLGRMHAATVGMEDTYRAGLARLGTAVPPDERFGMWTGVEGWDDIERAAAELGLPDATVARDDVAWVRSRLVDPGPLLVLTHTDLSPPNVVVGAGAAGVTLLDLEGSGFRHAGLDLAWLHFPFPNYSAHYAVLPPAVVEAADAAYRARFATSTVAYGELLAVGCAACLVVRAQRLRLLASAGQDPHDSWRRRTQLRQQALVFVDVARRTGYLPALARWFADLADAMVERWPDTANPPAPLFPAFPAFARRR